MTTRARKLRRRRAALAALALAASLLATGGAWLAETGTTVVAVSPPPGIAPDGRVASFAPMSASFTRPNGNAQIVAGLATGEIRFAQGYSTSLKVDMAWLNPGDAAQVLNNPNAQIHVGLYYPIYTGTCVGGEIPAVSSTRATIGTGFGTLCTRLDENASGEIVDGGKMILHRTRLAGFLRPGTADPAPAACTANTASTSWCAPSGLDADKNVLYVAVTIVTPGGKPAGQENNVSALEFYTAVTKFG